MIEKWTREERERAYTQLCETLTEVGPEQALPFLARLSLLLMESLADSAVFTEHLVEARETGPRHSKGHSR